jgi:hypothetical protein
MTAAQSDRLGDVFGRIDEPEVGVVVSLMTRSTYRPNYAAIARRRMATARTSLGLTREEFAEMLTGLVGWPVRKEAVCAWEETEGTCPPSDVLLAAGAGGAA